MRWRGVQGPVQVRQPAQSFSAAEARLPGVRSAAAHSSEKGTPALLAPGVHRPTLAADEPA